MAITASRRPARVEVEASSRKMDRGLREARAKIKALYRDEQRAQRSAAREVARREKDEARRRRALDAGGGARSLGGAALGLGAAAVGGVAVVSLARDVLELERGLTRFQIATDKTPEQMEAFRAALTATSAESGIARDKLLEGAAAYVALTGDAAGAETGMKLFGKVANATGASMEDIAATAAAMKDNLGIDPKDFGAAFSALAVQGKAGAVELRELSTLLAGIAPTFSQFKGGGGAAGLAEMGAAMQVVRKGFGSSAEAATGLQSLMVSITKNAGKFQKAGVRIYDKDPKTGKKRLRDFSDIIDEISKSKLAKDPTLLGKAFGRDEAKRAYDQLIMNRGLFDELIAKSSDADAINRDAAKYQTSAAGRVDAAWNKAKLTLAEAFTPERIEAAVKMIERLVAGLGRVGELIHGFMISEQQHRENQDFLAKREAGISKVQATSLMKDGKFMDRGAAEQQYVHEQTAYKMLRQGDYDNRSMADLASNRQRVQAGAFSNEADLVRLLDQRITNAFQRDLAKVLVPLTTILKVDGKELVRASANSPIHRTKAGGV